MDVWMIFIEGISWMSDSDDGIDFHDDAPSVSV